MQKQGGVLHCSKNRFFELEVCKLGFTMTGSSVSGISKGSIPDLKSIAALDKKLAEKYSSALHVQPSLSRKLVSYQANKAKPVYRWYKFKEAFSSDLVEYLIRKYGITSGTILDPFAGMGTTLFTASAMGIKSLGIELLPIGQELIKARISIQNVATKRDISRVSKWLEVKPWHEANISWKLPSIRITAGAYPPATVDSIEKYMSALQSENRATKAILMLALLCVLEQISYTRKDGQYLRWDHRSGRTWGRIKFEKTEIIGFDDAISTKLGDILYDAATLNATWPFDSAEDKPASIGLLCGSCLDLLPTVDEKSIDAIITSPPYCNRYDYTRTYALELALLGVGESEISKMRQQMLSCTVENKEKDLSGKNSSWQKAIEVANNQLLLQTILEYLDALKMQKMLNNNGIPGMVRGYFYEMACVLQECSRILKQGALLFMVNDNVRYAGASVSVDLILSDIASNLGFKVEEIMVLPNSKGNSSQQMGEYGREVLRKCIYIWSKK